jgi:hypothetical protein
MCQTRLFEEIAAYGEFGPQGFGANIGFRSPFKVPRLDRRPVGACEPPLALRQPEQSDASSQMEARHRPVGSTLRVLQPPAGSGAVPQLSSFRKRRSLPASPPTITRYRPFALSFEPSASAQVTSEGSAQGGVAAKSELEERECLDSVTRRDGPVDDALL